MGGYFSYIPVLPKGIAYASRKIFSKKELNEKEKREILNGDRSIEKIAEGIREGKYKKIICLTGAGLSTAAGIPDFRSSSGFYANVEKYGLNSPMDIFSISFFKENPEPFLKLAKDIIPKEGTFSPTYTHKFLDFLHKKGLLLRVWTQNVDGLEGMSGIPQDKLVEAHGHVRSCHCIKCHKMHDIEYFKDCVKDDKKPYCKFCKSLIKPDVTFFGEALPARFFSLFLSDFAKCDLLLVIGTSLKVFPFAGLVEEVSLKTPRVLFNMERVGPFRRPSYRDVVCLGKCDDTIEKLVKLCKWDKEFIRKKDEEKDNKVEEYFEEIKEEDVFEEKEEEEKENEKGNSFEEKKEE